MKAVKVDEAHRIQLSILKPGDFYEPKISSDAGEITLRRLDPTRREFTKADALKAIEESPLEFECTWDELRRDTRDL